ncbi:hypothetical protein BDM02DRAFT_3264218 [Thelephora ganbajun]|uniref:Uncharacterized protein n=1 Tax=Thelephora ganbajun TaxID=370292 RepID=A0ACB6Z0W5_THEGA|nr:hypothetical protein BDM02DRAFT_3264218 [Thelephora ganbajun]
MWHGCHSILLSFLPLAHTYGVERWSLRHTDRWQDWLPYCSPLKILESMRVLKSNFFPTVPRLLNRICQAIAANLEAPGLKGALFTRPVAAKMERLKATGGYSHPLWDRLIFNKPALGGNVALATSRSAPLNLQVLALLGGPCLVRMTKSCCTCTRCIPKDPTCGGFVGFIQSVNEIKLIDVPSMGYISKDKPYPWGEIYMGGANCFLGCQENEQATKEIIDREG